MPRTNTQFKGIREGRHQQILEAALELFAIEGYHTTSIQKIASRAGVSKGLLYNYFESKEALARAIIHQGIDQMKSLFDQDHDGELSDQEMKFFLDENLKLVRQNVAYWKMYYSTLLQPAVSNLVIEEYKDQMPELRYVLIKYFRHKGYPHPEMEAIYFSALLEGLVMNFILDPKSFPLEEMKNYILEKIHLNAKNHSDK